MLNMENVSQAASKLSTNKTLAEQGVIASLSETKANWDTMIGGTFSLLFPYIHKIFATRDELQEWLTFELDTMMINHCSPDIHAQAQYAQPVAPPNINVDEPITFPKEMLINRRTQVAAMPITVATTDDAPDQNLSAPNFQQVEVYSMSPFNTYLET